MCADRSKESANCRLELNYAQQNEDVDMIPLMMEKNYRPKVRRTLSVLGGVIAAACSPQMAPNSSLSVLSDS